MSILGALLGVAAGLMGVGEPAADRAPRYAEGQVWEYRTRPGDQDSLLKIQKIEPMPGAGKGMLVYHISIIRVDLGPTIWPGLAHVPVSKETLDASVIRLSARTDEFPSPEEGIAEWLRAEGGVYTIPVAEIIALVLPTIAGGQSGGE